MLMNRDLLREDCYPQKSQQIFLRKNQSIPYEGQINIQTAAFSPVEEVGSTPEQLHNGVEKVVINRRHNLTYSAKFSIPLKS